jgi:hypothetical protein
MNKSSTQNSFTRKISNKERGGTPKKTLSLKEPRLTTTLSPKKTFTFNNTTERNLAQEDQGTSWTCCTTLLKDYRVKVNWDLV